MSACSYGCKVKNFQYYRALEKEMNPDQTQGYAPGWFFDWDKSKEEDAEGKCLERDSHFLDVPNSAYYAPAVNWAVAEEITKGISVTVFSPDQPCTRAEAVTFLQNMR